MQDHERTPPPLTADERATLTGLLQFQRDTLAMKCAGLTADQLREQAVAPSTLSLLGLVRHLATVERGWFRNVIAAERAALLWPGAAAGESAEWEVGSADPDEAFRVWNEECEHSRAIVDAAESLDLTGRHGDEAFSLRYVLGHMVEEYARHNGHADLLRERLDGVTGE
ncbi:DinB family protein [Kitasatospora sp. NBC_00374]|uniref:DinB family protein n=1 Tax=Kitasatospora sp. NBC_00374 TaxID=2975964 RepID=UPI003243AC80